MKLHFLGTTGYHPSDERQTACLMLPEIGVILDAGTGMFRARDLLQTAALDIFITHAHLDHVSGLTYLFDVLHEKHVKQVLVHGEAEKLAQIEEHLFAPALFPVKPPFEFRPLSGRLPLPGGGVVTHRPVEHPGGAVAFRLDLPEASLAYVTDTTARADSPYLDFIRGVDVLVHECYFPDGFEDRAELTGHSCATPVARLAAAAGVGRLCLIHVNPLATGDDPLGLAGMRAIFPATELAADGDAIEL